MVVGSPIVLNLIPGGVRPVIMINETDKGYQKEFLIYNGNEPYNVPANVSATIRGTKRDGLGVTEAATVTAGSNVVRITVTEQMTAVPGKNIFELVFVNTSGLRVATINFIMLVERSALNANTVISESDIAYSGQVINELQSIAAYGTILDNKIYKFDTVAQMKTDTSLKVGMYARTGGYYAVNDGGGALYRIYSTAPSAYYETLNNGLYAMLITENVVYPEMYGAYGDDSHDDSTALRNAVASQKTVYLKKTYKITSTISINGNLTLFGVGTIHKPATDDIEAMFDIRSSGKVECVGITFKSERTNTNVHAPAGHTRATGSKSSNVNAFTVFAVDTLILRDCVCIGLEYDVNSTEPASGVSTKNRIHLINHRSTDYSCCAYVSNVSEFRVDGGYFKCYELLGSGDHCFYITNKTVNTIINEPIIYSYPLTGTTFDIHAYAETVTKYPQNLFVLGATMHCNSFIAAYCKGNVIIKKCGFYSLSADVTPSALTNPFQTRGYKSIGKTVKTIFDSCHFGARGNLQYPIPLTNPVTYKNCLFDDFGFSVSLTGEDADVEVIKYEFDNCSISSSDTTSIFYCGNLPYNYEIKINNSNLKQDQGDGFASLRGSGSQTVAFYNCHLERTAAKPYLEYASSFAGTYKFFNCCSEFGKIRGNGESERVIDVNNGFSA